MKDVQSNVVKSLKERIMMAQNKIEQDEQDIIYQNQIIIEAKELISKIEDEDDMQDM